MPDNNNKLTVIKSNSKRGRKSFDGSVLNMVREGETVSEYITKSLGGTRQNTFYHLRKLQKHGFIEVRDKVHKNGQSHIYGITSLGLKTDGLYVALSTRINRSNRSILSKYDSHNKFFDKNRYHNFKVVAKLDRNCFSNGFDTVNESLVASNNCIIGNSSYSTFNFSEIGSVFTSIDKKIEDYCENNEFEIVDRKYLVDKAEIRRKKELIGEFERYQDWTYDCSLGYPERENTFEFKDGELTEVK